MTAVSGAGAPQLPTGYAGATENLGQVSSNELSSYAEGKSPAVKDDVKVGASTAGPGALKSPPLSAMAGVGSDGFKSETKSNPVDGAARGTEIVGTAPSSTRPETSSWSDLYSAVYRATPGSFTREMDEYLTDVADYAMRTPDETYDIIKSAYASTPGSFYKEDELIVMAAALAGPRYSDDIRGPIREVWAATPGSFSSEENSLIMGAALLGDSAESGDIVRAAWNATPGSFDNAEDSAVMAAAVIANRSPSDTREIIRDVWNSSPGYWSNEDVASAMMDELLGDNYEARDSLAWLQDHYA
jgi:hypothetical protein